MAAILERSPGTARPDEVLDLTSTSSRAVRPSAVAARRRSTCAEAIRGKSELHSFADLIGAAFGAFADPSMPWPTVSVWETTRHPWVTFDHELDHLGRQGALIDVPVKACG